MPARLTGVIVLLSCSALLNFISGHWFTGALGVLLLAAWLKASEGTRYALIAFSGTGLALTAIVLLAEVETSTVPREALAGLLTGIAANAFSVWCLRQADVQDWMVRPSHPDAFRDAWRATGTSAKSVRLEEHRQFIAAAIARDEPHEEPVGRTGTRIWVDGIPPEALVEATVAIPRPSPSAPP